MNFTIGTAALVLALLAFMAPAQAELRAGVATADITPPIGGEMAGYSARGAKVSTGVHDPLSARALVLSDGEDTLAIVTADLAGLRGDSIETVKRGIKDRANIDHLMLVCSHTHSGPTPRRDFPSKEKSWLQEAEQKIIDAVVRAKASMVPVTYGVGKGEVREGHNRRKVNPDGSVTMFWRNEERAPTAPVDYALGVIQFNKLGGQPLATLVNFTCHAVVLGPENLLISADYPGVLKALVEEAVGGTCLFANGACGDINPFMDKSDPKNGAFEEMAKMGRALAKETIRVVRSIKVHESNEVDLTVRAEIMPVKPRWDVTDTKVVEALAKKHGEAAVRSFLSRFEFPMKGELVTVTLGDDLAIVGLPGEFFVQHGLDLKARSVIPNSFAFGYCNGLLGYFPTINAAWQGGYGAREATIVEVGAGETFINRALVNLYYQTGRLREIPEF